MCGKKILSTHPDINLHEADKLLFKWFELIAVVLIGLFKAIMEHGLL